MVVVMLSENVNVTHRFECTAYDATASSAKNAASQSEPDEEEEEEDLFIKE